MTPEQKLKHLVLIRHSEFGAYEFSLPDGPIDASNVDAIYKELYDDEQQDGMQDARNEIRSSGTETGLSVPYSRHYESDAVAIQYLDGSWVGFNFWYGGGKHGEPEAIDWMDDAYDVDCAEEEKIVTVQTFTRKEVLAGQ